MINILTYTNDYRLKRPLKKLVWSQGVLLNLLLLRIPIYSPLKIVSVPRLERGTFVLSGRCSSQLSYTPKAGHSANK